MPTINELSNELDEKLRYLEKLIFAYSDLEKRDREKIKRPQSCIDKFGE